MTSIAKCDTEKQMPITFENQVKKALFAVKPILLVTIFQCSPAALNMCQAKNNSEETEIQMRVWKLEFKIECF